jgi:putative redox protein
MADALHVEARSLGGLSAVVNARGHEVCTDEPEEVGGGDAGMMPTELLLSSLASCFCLAVAHVAAKRDLELPALQVSVDGERLGRELRYARLRVAVAAAVPREDLAPLVERAQRFCWVSNMLAEDIDVTYLPVSIPHPEPTDAGQPS